MNLNNLEKILESEPKYRTSQIYKYLFCDLIENWDLATSLSLNLREKLKKECSLEIKMKMLESRDKDNIKALVNLEDGLAVEAVCMMHRDERNTICVSSQVGCPLGCSFCATGKMGFKRNLNYWEIIEQVLVFQRLLKKMNPPAGGKKINNIVFMGMGEPFLNYNNVISAIKILNNKNCFNIGARHISISTVGITEGIRKLAEEKLQVNLAISLHAPNNELRQKIMIVNQKYPINDILEEVDKYIGKTNRRVMFEYIMIKDVNDTDDLAHELGKIMRGKLYFVNLISYNPTGIFSASPASKIKKFKNILEKEGINVTERHRFGNDINAACGQLAGGAD